MQSNDSDWDGPEGLLRKWLARIRDSQHSHHEAGKYYRFLNYALSMPVVVITTVVGTGAFASLERQTSITTKLWLGGLSMLAAVLTALQTHFQFGQRSEKHKNLGAQYGDIRRDIETVLVLPRPLRGDCRKALERIRHAQDKLATEGDVVPRWIFNRTKRILAKKDRTKEIPKP